MPSFRILLAFLLGGSAIFSGSPARAQINPDQTLGIENSVVTPDVTVRGGLADLIEGGAARGPNLFHSFSNFNVLEAERVYFANPDGIESILSRVTGNDLSNIFGTLGVDGAADLFLINPNGIVFGSDVNLDVEGSLYATTAEAVSLGNGIFSAAVPEQSELLVVSPRTSFFNYLTASSGDIVNLGEIGAGGNMTLAANSLDLQGQVSGGGNLSLLAADTIQIRDSVETPFVAFAGSDLLVQGNEQVDIVALSHQESGLFSYGDMVLRSAEQVGGDAHYLSGGDFRIEELAGNPGKLFSPFDPIIRAYGDVDIGRYEGTSLHIIAGGFVVVETAIVNAPDVGMSDVDFIQESISLSDGTVVEIDGGAQPTFDVRAGVNQDEISEFPFNSASGQNPVTDSIVGRNITDSPSGADIVVGDIWVNVPDGKVLLTNNYLPNLELPGGDIVITGEGAFGDGIDVGSPRGRGGDVFIDSRDNIQVVNSRIEATGSDAAGKIALIADDTITLANINSGRRSGLFSSVVASQEETGSDIRIIADNLEIRDGAQVNSFVGESGRSSDILITVDETIRLDGINPISGRASGIGTSVLPGGIGEGGAVKVTADNIEFLNGAQINTSLAGEGKAGDVTLNIEGVVHLDGNNSTQDRISGIYSNVNANEEQIGEREGGTLRITASNLEVFNGAQILSRTRGRGTSGNIILAIEETAHIEGLNNNRDIATISSIVDSTGIGNAGNVSIAASNLLALNGAQITSSSIGTGNAGNIILRISKAARFESGGVEGLSSGAFSSIGINGQGQAGDVSITAANLTVTNGARLDSSTSGIGNAGNIILNIQEDLKLHGWDGSDGDSTRVASSVNRNGIGDSGEIRISANSLEVTDGAQIVSATSNIGNAGNVVIEIQESVLLDGTNLTNTAPSVVSSSVLPNGTGNSGNIRLTASDFTVLNGAQLSSIVAGQGNAGNILVEVSDTVRLTGSDPADGGNSSVASSVEGRGQGGDISITSDMLEVLEGAQINASTFGEGNAGSIILKINKTARFDGSDPVDGTPSLVSSNVEDGAGNGGNISVVANNLELLRGSLLLTGVSGGQENGGDIILRINEDVILEGRNPLNGNPSAISSSIAIDGNGEGGDLSVDATNIFMRDNSFFSTESLGGQGNSGNIRLNVRNRLHSQNSNISTTSVSNSGGNIQINAATVILRGDSNIISGVGFGDNEGGNITIESNALVALENSDILSAAVEGEGGNIDLSRTTLFSNPLDPVSRNLTRQQIISLDNDRVDINATGSTTEGDISISNNNFVENDLNELPDGLVNPETLVANSCIARIEHNNGTLLLTGSDRLLQSPAETQPSPYSVGTVQPVPSDVSEPTLRTITEPSAIYELADGRLVLNRDCEG